MNKPLKVGILRETKNPPDRRVPLTPPQIIALEELYPYVEFYVQPSDLRCYSDEEYEYLDIPLKEDLGDCDILLGVKEVDRRTFITGKTYLFFAHVAKKQPYNRDMLRDMVEKKISLIDFEYLTTDSGQRVVAFGRFAGIVGAYNGLRARGIKTNRFRLKPACHCHDLDEMWAGLRLIEINPGFKILVTGEGRVARGAIETLGIGNIEQVNPEEYLTREFDVPVFCQIGPQYYTRHKAGHSFDFKHFILNHHFFPLLR
jgi:saccharopine dehydrogenase (NAD+, L-lysine-forming)